MRDCGIRSLNQLRTDQGGKELSQGILEKKEETSWEERETTKKGVSIVAQMPKMIMV